MRIRETGKGKRKRSTPFGMYLFLGGLFLAAAAASLKLPSVILDWQDEKMVGQQEIQPAQEVIVTAQEDMSILEKIHLAESGNVNSMFMENGRHYNQESAGNKAREELGKLLELGILTDWEPDGLLLEIQDVEFLLDMEDGEHSMMLWRGSARAGQGQWFLNWQMDDETGKLLSVSQYRTDMVGRGIYDVDVSETDEYPDGDGSTNGRAYAVRDKTIEDKMGVEETSRALVPEELYAGLTEKAQRWGEYLGLEMTESGIALPEIRGFEAEGYGEIEQYFQEMRDKNYSWTEAYYLTLSALGVHLEDLYSFKEMSIYAVYKEEGENRGIFYFQTGEQQDIFIAGAVS